ncbi:thioredoxin-like protein [Gonapodya prolifera JEL478]|uniref:Thioredoxin-like protein n=1 Tax=Gonapodya prolifera (strain JEL478) TaxID=1344416 RepID=A0A139ACT1_GONPJ|nr:thioredoxin-like protein [Gonapodya prolifera JEL478]|eukprot:KXS14587.1 thioredoxin-like protein [Gonapodya prolifera JEL478]
MPSVREVPSDSAFESELSAARSKPVIVDFYADWCGPCKVIGPYFDQIAGKYPSLIFLRVNVDNLPSASSKAGVRAMPTFAVFSRGVKIDELVGADPSALEALVKKHAKSAGGDNYWKDLGAGGRTLGGPQEEQHESAPSGPGSVLSGAAGAAVSGLTSAAGVAGSSAGYVLGGVASIVGSILGGSSDAAAGVEEKIPGSFDDLAGGKSLGGNHTQTVATATPATTPPASSYPPPNSALGPSCTLAVRLASGSVLRPTFSANDTLGTVTSWVSAQVGSSVVVGTTFPKKKYTGALLDRTLAEEGLASRGQVVVM